MSLKIRLKEIVKYSDLDPTNFGKQFESVGIETIRKILKHENPNPSFEFIAELFSLYPEISYRWFFFGQGNMILKNKYIAEEENHYVGSQEPEDKYDCKNPSCKKEIDYLKMIIDQKEESLELYRKQDKKETGSSNSTQLGEGAKQRKIN
jgi:hypothetical protein